MSGAVLHHGVSGSQRHLDADGVSGMHARVRRVHVAQQTRQLPFDIGDGLLDVEEFLLIGSRLGRQRQHAEPEAPDRREVGPPLRHRPVVGKQRCAVAARRTPMRPVNQEGV
jgi:hypothetical protein